MTAPVVDLSTWSDPVIAERLRDLLARAEAGELRSIGIIVTFHDGSTGEAWGRDPRASVQGLVYGCEMLKARLLKIGLDA